MQVFPPPLFLHRWSLTRSRVTRSSAGLSVSCGPLVWTTVPPHAAESGANIARNIRTRTHSCATVCDFRPAITGEEISTLQYSLCCTVCAQRGIATELPLDEIA